MGQGPFVNTLGLKLNNNNKGQVQAHNSPSQPIPHGSIMGTFWACSEFRACAQKFLGKYKSQ